MNKPFDEFWKSARNRMTALGAVLLSAGEDARKEVPPATPDQLPVQRLPTSSASVTAASGEIPSEAPRYDGNLLPSMTAMVTGFVDKLAKHRTIQQIACTEAARELDERAARLCAHCLKPLPDVLYVYWRGYLLHQECRVPFIVAHRELADIDVRYGGMEIVR